MEADLAALGERLKARRQACRLSLDGVARETGVSKAMLGQIERGESTPTVATLWKIASGLRVPMSYFLAPGLTPASRSSIPWHQDASGMTVLPLFAFDPGLGFEMFVIDLPQGTFSESPAHAPGIVEHVVVIEGAMELAIEGQWHRLEAGDAMRFAADRPHAYRNLDAPRARIHDLIHYPAGM
ncbi:XRE family transcriptional regulator [Salinicola endophyticus]|uniref:XRE family transcriptional regulator n=1 Tax=Salinicola endophyticus TaxID=1949083 RepID=A0AB74UJC0_9GAMM